MSCSSKYEKLVEYIKSQREVYGNIMGFVDNLESEETISNFTMPDFRIDTPDSIVDFTNSGYASTDNVLTFGDVVTGISTANAEVNLMEPRSFDEMPRAIQALRERKTVILNLTMMEPDQAQRAVDFVAGGTFAIDGHQERVGESIFLFAPSCVTVTNSFQEEASPSSMVNKGSDLISKDSNPAPEPAWGETMVTAL